ncbi:MAG: esterase-like activity of phytase family protein [Ferruginibacter sp.]
MMILLGSCSASKNTAADSRKNISIGSLKFLDEYVIPHNLPYQNTLVGGLSGIDYNPKTNSYFIISDERSFSAPARFYTADIRISHYRIDSVVFTSVHTLKQPGGSVFPSFKQNAQRAPDPESIRYNAAKNTLLWTSEGDRAVREGKMIYQDPYIYEMDLQGNFRDSFFIPSNEKMYVEERGSRENGVFEGSSFDDTYKWLYVSMEQPIYEDGPIPTFDYAGAPIRITKYNAATRKPVAQYAYPLDAVANAPKPDNSFFINGVDEILWIGNNRFLVMERSFSNGTPQNTIKIFLADISTATDVSEIKSLYRYNGNYNQVSKKLLFNLSELNRYVDNVEGITLGPVLPNGHRSLILIADNNFNAFEKSQVFLFEIIP